MGISGTDKAYLFALSGVARAGASRSNYFDTNLCVSIGGTQYADGNASTSYGIIWGSLTITDVLDETPNTCSLTAWGFTPTVGQEVIITLGSTNNLDRLFAGQILSVSQTYLSVPAIVAWNVRAIDYTWLLNRRKVIAQYTATSAGTIAATIMGSFTSGFTTVNVATGLDTVDEITFTNQDVTEALTNLARRVGAYWYIDYQKDLHFFTTDSGTDPTSLTAAHPSLWGFAIDSDLGQWVTRVYVEGGGVNALAEVSAGETIIPVDDTAWYQAGSGTVVSGPQRISYADIASGGSGTLVGPGTYPSAAPSLALASGAGLGSGVYRYAYTFVTAAGESLPSPLAPITTGVTAVPDTSSVAALAGGGSVNAGVHSYAITFVTGSGETTASPSCSATTLAALGVPGTAPNASAYTSSGNVDEGYHRYTVTNVNAYGETAESAYDTSYAFPGPGQFTFEAVGGHAGIPVGPAGTIARKLYRSKASDSGGTRYLVGTITGNSSTYFVDNVSDAALGSAAPGSDTTAALAVSLTSIPIGPSAVTGRNVYRTVAGGAQLKLLTSIVDNATTSWSDSAADATLGANVPTSNSATANQVSISGIAIGAAAVTSRKVYRTVVDGSQLKLQQTIANNTATVGVTDVTADGALGANVPTSDASGLTQPDGQLLAGETSILVAGAGAFSATGGWAVIGNGRQTVRYTGITGNTLTGVPTSGNGSIVASIGYNSTITAAPALTGVPASGTGAILYTIKQGDSVNLLVQVDDTVKQAALAALIGGDGIQDAYIQDRRLSYTECVARANATHTLNGSTAQTVTYNSRDLNTKSGRSIVVNLAAPTSVSGTFKIQRVTISGFSPNEWPTYAAEASSTRFSFEDVLRRLKG